MYTVRIRFNMIAFVLPDYTMPKLSGRKLTHQPKAIYGYRWYIRQKPWLVTRPCLGFLKIYLLGEEVSQEKYTAHCNEARCQAENFHHPLRKAKTCKVKVSLTRDRAGDRADVSATCFQCSGEVVIILFVYLVYPHEGQC